VLDFPEMTQSGTLASLGGTYTLTMVAGDNCAVPYAFGGSMLLPLPVADRTRSYSAVITQNGPRVHIALSGANFYLHDGVGNYVDARLEPSALLFPFGQGYYYSLNGPDVSEVLPSGRVLAIDGFASTDLPPANTHGPISVAAVFHGTFREYELLAGGNVGQVVANCASEAHRLTLTPASATTQRRRR
jgi:hypothetical protein